MTIEQDYDNWSLFYDTDENKTRDLDQKVTIETLNKFSFNTVIELGCGTGKNTVWLLKMSKQIVGIDISKGMLDIADKKITSNKLKLINADLNKKWPVQNNYADLVTCNLTLEHIENLNHIFNQSFLKLKDKGKFFICELHPFKQYLGSRARYETKERAIELNVFIHHTSEYLDIAKKNNFKLIELREWFDNKNDNAIPRLISFVFEIDK